MNWKPISSAGELDAIDRHSGEPGTKGVIIFKHSNRCSISSMAWSRMDRSWDLPETEAPVYYVDVIAQRELSNAIAERYGVVHESPQALVIRKGQCVYHASHNINPDMLAGALQDQAS